MGGISLRWHRCFRSTDVAVTPMQSAVNHSVCSCPLLISIPCHQRLLLTPHNMPFVETLIRVGQKPLVFRTILVLWGIAVVTLLGLAFSTSSNSPVPTLTSA